MLAEFDYVTSRNTAGRAVEKIAIDNGAKLRRWQGVISPHQILDFKAAVFADGLQRRDRMSDTATFRERQQQPFIGDDPSIDVIDVGDGVDGKGALHAFVVDRHHDGYESGPEIFVEKSALAGIAIGGRHTRAVALDRQARRQLYGIDSIIYEVRKFVGEPRGLVFLDARHQLLAGVKPQPGVQQITLLDRFDDRRVGAFEFQGCNPFSMQSR